MTESINTQKKSTKEQNNNEKKEFYKEKKLRADARRIVNKSEDPRIPKKSTYVKVVKKDKVLDSAISLEKVKRVRPYVKKEKVTMVTTDTVQPKPKRAYVKK